MHGQENGRVMQEAPTRTAGESREGMAQASRRAFLRWSVGAVGALSISPCLLSSGIVRASSLPTLVNNGDISLPPGFRYVKFSAWGDLMSDGRHRLPP